ncbi:hypothetical protein [Candidatus Mycoplasma haematominutum]|uniref:hypothetical protein n=1 Tax=Candidatus Mycoplasma haematominutum TaxID=209446 RepID=UPI0003169609|nr:hypothetical protein [Candidatus Mycoplasma haematominutum]
MLWIYISRNIDSLELKIEEFLEKFKGAEMLHLRRPSFEDIKNQLLQVRLFGEIKHFLFEDFIGSFADIEKLFSSLALDATILITKLVEQKVTLPWSLIEKLEDRNYLLNRASLKSRIKYLELVLKREEVTLSPHYLSLVKKGGLNSAIQIRGIVEQLKLLGSSSQDELSESTLRAIISSNNVVEYLDEKWSFLEWYLTGRIKEWYLFLLKVSTSSSFIQEFLRSFCSSLNYNFWNSRHNIETLLAIRELSYNFFIFTESYIFKIKKDSFSPVTYFFWKNRPLRPLLWMN